MLLLYVFICATSFFVLTWTVLRLLNKSDMPPNNDDDGGSPLDENLPVIDLPPGSTLEEYLVDRWHTEVNSLRSK